MYVSIVCICVYVCTHVCVYVCMYALCTYVRMCVCAVVFFASGSLSSLHSPSVWSPSSAKLLFLKIAANI